MTDTICKTCGDTHLMDSPDGGKWPCTRCPTPCEKCRLPGGAYCRDTRCACVCHSGAEAMTDTIASLTARAEAAETLLTRACNLIHGQELDRDFGDPPSGSNIEAVEVLAAASAALRVDTWPTGHQGRSGALAMEATITQQAQRIAALEEGLRRVVAWLNQHRLRAELQIVNGGTGDWACAECRPASDVLKAEFRCAFHLARALLSDTKKERG